jgi:ADP-ribosylglycohydrolase
MNTGIPPTSTGPVSISAHSRFLGAWWGLFIGDALAVPADGYFNTEWLKRDYGRITTYTPIHEPHPNCEMSRAHFTPTGERDNIVHQRGELWRKPGTHYHHGLRPGDITLPATLSRLLAEALVAQKGTYDEHDFTQRYLQTMLNPDGHRDTYIPSAHRNFFKNRGLGRAEEKCGEDDTHIAGLVEAAPLMLAFGGDAVQASRLLRRHISIVRPSAPLIHGAEFFSELLTLLFQGWSLNDAIYVKLGHMHHPYLAYPYHRWIEHQDDATVARHHLSQGPLADEAVPLALYLALRYSDDTEQALQASVALGGDAAHRTSLVGLLLGAQNGCESIPAELATGLTDFTDLDKLGDELWSIARRCRR